MLLEREYGLVAFRRELHHVNTLVHQCSPCVGERRTMRPHLYDETGGPTVTCRPGRSLTLVQSNEASSLEWLDLDQWEEDDIAQAT
jgi:hypothetical protein